MLTGKWMMDFCVCELLQCSMVLALIALLLVNVYLIIFILFFCNFIIIVDFLFMFALSDPSMLLFLLLIRN